MANPEHEEILRRGMEEWNAWRQANPNVRPDLSGADLSKLRLSLAYFDQVSTARANFDNTDFSGANLYGVFAREAIFDGATLTKASLGSSNLIDATIRNADLREAGMIGALLRKTDLRGSDLTDAELSKADLFEANLSGATLAGVNFKETLIESANLSGADLRGAYLWFADVSGSDLSGANLAGADLTRTRLIGTNLVGADLSGCSVYGVAVWDVDLRDAKQTNLVLNDWERAKLTVDNLEVAQFVYLLMKNEKIRGVIDTITSKVVLILGRFTEERKRILDAVREELRGRGYVPVIFDFPPSPSRDLTETVQSLASMAKFVIADLTDAKSIPQELSAIIPHLPSVPVQPILLASQKDYAMFEHWRRYPWVLDEFLYKNERHLLDNLQSGVIGPAEARRDEEKEDRDLKAEVEELKRKIAELEGRA